MSDTGPIATQGLRRGAPATESLAAPTRYREIAKRLAFFVLAAFIVIRIFPFPLDRVPLTQALARPWGQVWAIIVPAVADHVLHLPFDVRSWSGGGEPTFYYIEIGCMVALSAIVGLLWVFLDRGRADLAWIGRWLRVYLRLFLASVLFVYAWGKIIPTQFPLLGPDRLSETFGETSPMGLLWTFMGFSTSYTAFAGWGELAAAVLVSFRRTTGVGALIGVAVMSNVVALNFAYDVGVKLDASFYLLGFAYLAAPDAVRLFRLLVLNHALPSLPTLPLLRSRRWNAAVITLSGVLAAYFFVDAAGDARTAAHQWGRLAPRPPLYGLYDVTVVERNGLSYSLLPPDSTLWARVALGQHRSTIRLASGQLGSYLATVDTVGQTVRFTSRDDPPQSTSLRYHRTDSGRLRLDGRLGPDSVTMFLVRRDERSYRLVSHPFHWAQDTAENR